ncbi:MAG: hypothetical protein M3483_03735, partial [Gemmatimonadota bacterium]|nr:hypothetical protein [Gemmatimonadota bacterium]
RALRLLPTRDGAGALEQRRMAAKDLLLAALAPTATARLAVALATAPSGGRGDFRGVLEAFALWLRDLLAIVEGVPETIANLPDAEALSRIAQRAAIPPLGIGRALDRVYAAIDLASGNVNPQLVLADLLRAVRSDLLETA